MRPGNVPECGVHMDVPLRTYLEWDAVSSSVIRGLEEGCPAEVAAALVNPSESTPALLRGTLFALMVEHGTDDPPGTTRIAGRINAPGVEAAVQRAEAEGLIVLRLKAETDAFDEAVRMYHAVCADGRYGRFLNRTFLEMREVSLVWDDPDTGLRCKARPDQVKRGSYVADWKTAREVHDWAHVVRTMQYHVQAAFHRRGAIACGQVSADAPYHWLPVRNVFPFATAGVKTCGLTYLAIGEEIVSRRMDQWAQCKASGVYPTYPDETIEPAGWYAQQFMEE